MDVTAVFGAAGSPAAKVFSLSLAYGMHKAQCNNIIPTCYATLVDCMLSQNPAVVGVSADADVTIDEDLIGTGYSFSTSDYAVEASSRRGLGEDELTNDIEFTVSAPATATDAVVAVKAAETTMVAAAAKPAAEQVDALLAAVNEVSEQIATAQAASLGVDAATLKATIANTTAAIETAFASATIVTAAPVLGGSATDPPAASGAYSYSLTGVALVAAALLM